MRCQLGTAARCAADRACDGDDGAHAFANTVNASDLPAADGVVASGISAITMAAASWPPSFVGASMRYTLRPSYRVSVASRFVWLATQIRPNPTCCGTPQSW
jgi:hypothetical protein